MNYITSCPKCETQFILNDDLIKAHRGKVQCGTCELIFNAKTRLTEVADDITSADEYQASLGEPGTSQNEEIILEPSENVVSDHFINDKVEIAIAPDPVLEVNAPSIFDDLSNDIRTPNKTTKHPALCSLFSLLLILLAATQTIYHMRVKVAAEYPQFKPQLMQACSLLNCSIGLPKDLDLITVGASDMQEDDSYQSVINFTSSLTNSANYAQAYPSIVLTLTNENDHVVIKKLIKPESYLPANKKIKNGIAGRSISTIKLPLYVHDAAVAGYRILLTYP